MLIERNNQTQAARREGAGARREEHRREGQPGDHRDQLVQAESGAGAAAAGNEEGLHVPGLGHREKIHNSERKTYGT